MGTVRANMILIWICSVLQANANAPCQRPKIHKNFTVFGWSDGGGDNYPDYPHANISHLAMYPTEDVSKAIGFLHTKNIRIQRPITQIAKDHLSDPVYRRQQINNWCYDGLSFDVEVAMFANETKDDYALLVEETREALDKLEQHLELSMAVPFTTEPLGCISGRCKRWKRMSLAMDQVFVMGYDSQDNILVATASSPLDKIQSGLESYLALGIPSSKLVLGVHWMSFVFPCIFTRHRRPGTIPPCFVDFKNRRREDIDISVDICTNQSLDGLHYDSPSHTMYCTTRNEPPRHKRCANGEDSCVQDKFEGQKLQQRWYDSPGTLDEKFRMARSLGVSGFGMWYMDAVKYPVDKYPLSAAYWQSISRAARTPL